LSYSFDSLDFLPGSLVVAPGFATGATGTIDDPQHLVNEAGGVTPSLSPPGAGNKQLLFTVDATVKASAAPGSLTTISLGSADVVPTHNTLVAGIDEPVTAGYGSVELLVPLNPWHNPINALDVNNDGFTVGLDAVLVINALNSGLAGPLSPSPTPPFVPPPYLDVDGDGNLSSIDAVLIINYLNSLSNLSSMAAPAQQPVVSLAPAEPARQATAAVASVATPSAVAVSTAPESIHQAPSIEFAAALQPKRVVSATAVQDVALRSAMASGEGAEEEEAVVRQVATLGRDRYAMPNRLATAPRLGARSATTDRVTLGDDAESLRHRVFADYRASLDAEDDGDDFDLDQLAVERLTADRRLVDAL
jgi:hypothetical protein